MKPGIWNQLDPFSETKPKQYKNESKSSMGTTYLDIKPLSHWNEIRTWYYMTFVIALSSIKRYLLISLDHSNFLWRYFWYSGLFPYISCYFISQQRHNVQLLILEITLFFKSVCEWNFQYSLLSWVNTFDFFFFGQS